MGNEKRWNIKKESLESADVCKTMAQFQIAKGQMRLRTSNHELYGLIAKNKSIHEFFGHAVHPAQDPRRHDSARSRW